MFEEYRGRRQMELCEHPVTKRGVELWLERVLAFYGEDGGVDVEVIDDQLILNEKTAKYIYSADFTPDEIKYEPGSRPMLENIVSEFTGEDMTEREKVRALMRRCRDNRDRGLAQPGLFYGGSEEELLKRGAIMCNEISRVFACLCQAAGLPARLFCSHISGHMMAEVKVSGKWWWIDPMKGLALVDENDEPLSAWDIFRNPKIAMNQPKYVIDDCRPPTNLFGDDERNPREIAFTFARIRDCYFHPLEACAIGNYYAWEHRHYSFPWRLEAVSPDTLREARRLEALNRKKGGWPDYYFLPGLFDEELKVRL